MSIEPSTRCHAARACARSVRWYQTDKEPGREMPLLSTYLGHVCVSGTYWYLSGNPELMTEAMTCLERRWGESS